MIDQKKKDSIKITDLFPHHSNTCSPCKDQHVMVRNAVSDYGILIALILKDLIKPIDLNHFVNSQLICELIQEALSQRKYTSFNDCKGQS